MRKLSVFLLLTVSLSIVACSTGMKPVKYDTATVQTNKKLQVKLHSGIIQGGNTTAMVPAGNIMIPVNAGSHKHLRFHEEDQRLFAKNLEDEIARLGLAKITSQHPEALVNIIFTQTQHVGSSHKYTLDVALVIQAKNKKDFAQKYVVDSEEGVGFFTRMNTNAGEGKTRAAKMLMNKIIPDIESYLKTFK